MISRKPEDFKEQPGQVRDSRPGPLLSWQSNFCRCRRGGVQATAEPGATLPRLVGQGPSLHPARQLFSLSGW